MEASREGSIEQGSRLPSRYRLVTATCICLSQNANFLLIDLRERNIDLLFRLCIHLLVSCMCPDRGSNPQPSHIWTMPNPLRYPALALKNTI